MNKYLAGTTLFVLCLLIAGVVRGQKDSLIVDWDDGTIVSKSIATLQVVVNPLLRRSSPIHQPVFAALRDLNCDYVRYVPWLPYPKLAVAELAAPASNRTSWDFTAIDPMTLDFLEATKGHPVVMNFSTIPAWMYKTERPVSYPDDPDSVSWAYTQGTVPRDSTMQEIAAYYGRLFSWYTRGGFTDELGVRHSSGYHFNIPYWEILNEVDGEHVNTPASYTKLYDAVAGEILKIEPATKFVGLALTDPNRPEWYEYFLDPKNHRPGIPVNMISYHFYALGSAEQNMELMSSVFFTRADGFLNAVKFIESIRNRLSPATKTTVDEVGSILANDFSPKPETIPDTYWNLSGALYAYLYLGLTKMGIDIIGESQLVGFPSQFPSVSMVNWASGKPNARFWALKLIKDNFGPGDILVNTVISGSGDLLAQGFQTARGKKVLFINKTNRNTKLLLPASFKGNIAVVDPSTGENRPVTFSPTTNEVEVSPFAVGVISF
jgi:hypothetical protein